MFTIYYMNPQVVDQDYAQIVPYLQDSFEEWKSKKSNLKGKLTIKAFFQFIFGVDLGGIDASLEQDFSSGEKTIKKLSTEHKLLAVLASLHNKNKLVVATDDAIENVSTGDRILFESKFAIVDDSDDVAVMEGMVGAKTIVIHFSKSYVPASILTSLTYSMETFSLNGYGVVQQSEEQKVYLRAVAFGLGFLDIVQAADERNK